MSAGAPTIEDICRRYYIRYSRLKGAIPYAFANNDPREGINIFIDLYGLYHTIYSRTFRTQITDYVSFTSQMVNLCSHYRGFFKYIGVPTKIFLISSFNTPSYIKNSLIPEYNKTMDEKRNNKLISEMMNFNFELLDILCPYLPDIFFLQTEFESTVLMYEIMNREVRPNLIISTDLYPLQLCTVVPNTAFITPIWIRNENGETEDISPICPPCGHPEHELSFTYIIRRKNGKTLSEGMRGSVIASNYVLLQALNQCKDRDIPVLYNSRTAAKMINEVPGMEGQKIFPQDLKYLFEGNEETFDLILRRFRALDFGFQNVIFRESLECKTLHYENLSDPDAVNLINSKYFQNNPLDLLRL